MTEEGADEPRKIMLYRPVAPDGSFGPLGLFGKPRFCPTSVGGRRVSPQLGKMMKMTMRMAWCSQQEARRSKMLTMRTRPIQLVMRDGELKECRERKRAASARGRPG